ncbi:hypothetical protein SAMN05660909_04689 [Chitinophaga terrae (ex Kim and Jung 2007)]|uniref:BZIP transcription factor n=1 Tax=Chitinophaga terrae (ex Kim and Jung 2007) TaxID=408074 RepID=A0A1H4FTR7_9BACT|nr:hypothetical protein [Chitinophaga terrae (ex Kim and Jung 2007)]GEP92876.1 hypothetical protein CTE07_45210 [Chitinophaga terrae (ex Kim and Jung 2007)]SEB00743.1 hypothetical protein SAMN05660909_04689 [Chitinophaga terrae (ex Kim and Jung 2007)]
MMPKVNLVKTLVLSASFLTWTHSAFSQTLEEVASKPNGNYTTKNIWIGMAPDATATEQALNIGGRIKLLGTANAYTPGIDGTQPTIYRSGTSAGTYPFNTYDNLVLQAGIVNKDIVMVTGNTPAPRMVIKNDGFIGVGTTSPTTKLDVRDGSININPGANNVFRIGYANMGNTTYGNSPYIGFNAFLYSSNGSNVFTPLNNSGAGLVIKGDDAGSGLHFYQRTFNNPSPYYDLNTFTEVMTLTPNGALGIGTNSTGVHKLAVEGSIGARKVKVNVSGWADFVFDPSYDLPKLADVERYVKEHRKLEGIPSAEEVNSEGIELGDMNKRLLQKVEELTLYLIEMKKENEELKAQNQQILDRVTVLEKKQK